MALGVKNENYKLLNPPEPKVLHLICGKWKPSVLEMQELIQIVHTQIVDDEMPRILETQKPTP